VRSKLGALRPLTIARGCVCVAVATLIAVLGWAWGHLSWTSLEAPQSATGLGLALFALTLALCWRGTGREASRRWGYLSVALALALPTCGGCLTAMHDLNPGGGTNFMLSNNTPANAGPGLGWLLLGGSLLALSALWPLRRVRREADPRRAPLTCVLAGSWLLGGLSVVTVLCRTEPIYVERWLLPYAGLGALSIVLGLLLRKPAPTGRWAALAAAVVLTTIALGVRESRTPLARCERAGGGGLVKSLRRETIAAYAAPGVELQRLVCKQTFQYADEETHVVYGELPDGHELDGKQLFARVRGTPLQRAQAARELLVADDCDELVLPSLDAWPALAAQGAVLPSEAGGKLVFYGLHHDYVYGRGTTVGMLQELTRYSVDLRTFETTRERRDE
jgi:hypothetical protein